MKSALTPIGNLPRAIKLISAILITLLLPMLAASYYNLQRRAGETIRFRGMHLRHDFEIAGSAALDYLATRPDVDGCAKDV